MLRIALAPCSPFTVSPDLMRESAGAGARLRGPLAHPPGRDAGRGALLPGDVRAPPVEYAEELGWVGAGRLARALRPRSTARASRLGATRGTGVAHCPCSNMRLASGIAPVRRMRAAGVRGRAGRRRLGLERWLAHAGARRGRRCCCSGSGTGPGALTAREALRAGDARRRGACWAATTSACSRRAWRPTSSGSTSRGRLRGRAARPGGGAPVLRAGGRRVQRDRRAGGGRGGAADDGGPAGAGGAAQPAGGGTGRRRRVRRRGGLLRAAGVSISGSTGFF